MKVNVLVDLNAEKIAELAGQLPAKEFSRAKRLIEEKARSRFRAAVTSAQREFRRSGLKRNDVSKLLEEIRAKKK